MPGIFVSVSEGKSQSVNLRVRVIVIQNGQEWVGQEDPRERKRNIRERGGGDEIPCSKIKQGQGKKNNQKKKNKKGGKEYFDKFF